MLTHTVLCAVCVLLCVLCCCCVVIVVCVLMTHAVWFRGGGCMWMYVVLCCCVLLCECMSDNKLGAEGGAAVAEAMRSCKQLTSVYLGGMACLRAVCVVRCHC